jgi:hypothetical protein
VIPFAEAVAGIEREITDPPPRRLRGLQRQRRGRRHQAADLPDLRRPGPGRPPPGLLHRADRLPALPRRGPDDRQPLPRLLGTGAVQKETTLKLNIPAGVDDGQTLRISGRGHGRHQGRPAGNLYVVIAVEPTPGFSATSSTSTARSRSPWSRRRSAAPSEVAEPRRRRRARDRARHPARPRHRPQGQGHPGARRPRPRRPPHPRRGHGPDQAHERARGDPSRAGRELGEAVSEKKGFFSSLRKRKR